VVIEGEWETRRGGYGYDHMFSQNNSDQLKTVKFYPEVPVRGDYEIFTYLSKNKDRAPNVRYTIYDGKKSKEKVIDNSTIEELGLSSGEWVSLGTYNFSAGKKSFIEVSNKDAEGQVTVDAMILKSVRK